MINFGHFFVVLTISKLDYILAYNLTEYHISKINFQN